MLLPAELHLSTTLRHVPMAIALLEYLNPEFHYEEEILMPSFTTLRRLPAAKEEGVEQTDFPNPAGVTSMITITTNEPGTEIIVMDLTGRTLIHQYFQGTQAELDVSSLANGIYLITVFNQNRPIGTEKLVIQK